MRSTSLIAQLREEISTTASSDCPLASNMVTLSNIRHFTKVVVSSIDRPI